jgi:hypothetical protein
MMYHRTVETVFTQNDYLVRVLMNDLIMRLDINNQEHCLFANKMIDSLLAGINRDELYDYTHTFTVEHRLKVSMMFSRIDEPRINSCFYRSEPVALFCF